MTSKFLKRPELVDTVEDGLGTIHQSTAHLLQVAKDCDIAVTLDPRCWYTHNHHLWVSSNELPIYPET